jgi:uncharacterized protein (TIGR02246 family)
MPLPKLILVLATLLLSAAAAQPLRAQRDLYGMGGASVSEVRRRFEAETREQVSALLVDYESAWGSRDLAALVSLYAGNATLYPASSGMVTGRAGIRDYFSRALPGLPPLRTRVMELRASGDLAFATVQMQYDSVPGGGTQPLTATDVFALRRGATGGWSILSHLSRAEPGGGGARAGTPGSGSAADSTP